MNSEEERALRQQHIKRGYARALGVLRDGDRITFTSCPGTKRWAYYSESETVGFSGPSISSRTRDDISPLAISKVNGDTVDFSDAGGLPYTIETKIEVRDIADDDDLPF
ncbi:hypothetical protein HF272_13585 [Rhizobium leguminosarum]|uniref:hypothetical protein n=1 Tax=Rhizobium leguminosarum TaxID=384 RepID=UPI001C90D269|nr:hypothetical protein [Rhizobium leguminosarum]MBY2992461.1 hypothetical protein [Rhizobium leguminosarum]